MRARITDRPASMRMRKALVNVFVDDVRFVKHEITLDQDRYLAVRIHRVDIFGLVEQIDIANLKVHPLFEQHEATPL